MRADRPRRPWRRPVALAVAIGLVVLLLVAGALVLRGDDEPDPLAGVRDVPVVAAATEDDGDVAVRLRPGITARQLPAVLDRIPDDADRTTLALGRASLEVEDGVTPDPGLLEAFVALSTVRAPGGRLAIERLAANQRVEAEVRRPAQAAPLAREILARLTAGGRRIVGIDGVEVRPEGAFQADRPPVQLRRLGGSEGRLEAALLDAAVALEGRRPRVSTNGDEGELRPRADGVSDAGAAWRAATRALRLPAAERRDVTVYVDVAATVDGRERTAPLLSGPADDDPGPALALLRAWPPAVTGAFVATDRRFAEATATGPRPAKAVASAARSAGVRRLTLRWPARDEEESSRSSSPSAVDGDADERVARDRVSVARLEDAPGAVLGLLPGVARAHRLGIDEVRWSADAEGDRAAVLQVAPPAWIDSDRPLTDQPARLRRYARAIRAVDWPGSARLALPLGRRTCKAYPGAQGVAKIRSTSDGRARAVEPVGTCTDPAAVAAARRAWNATAG